MYLFSSEIRWFVKGRIPDDVFDWFCEGHEYTQSAPRDDQYLKLPGTNTVGIKMREGRFEIKVRRCDPSSLSLADSITGYSDDWIRWSSRDLGIDRLIRRTDAWESSEWLTVRKERWLRWYGVSEVRPSGVPLALSSGSGCSVELTELQLNGDHWWTVSLEAQGAPDDLGKLLRSTGEQIFGERLFPHTLNHDNSYAYPSWLTRFTEVEGDHPG